MFAWRHPRRSERVDALSALLLCAGAELEVVLSGAGAASAVAGALCTLPLAVRRRAPLVACTGVLAAAVIGHQFDDAWKEPFVLAMAALLAAYSASAYGAPLAAVAGGLLAMLGIMLPEWWWSLDTGEHFDPLVALVVVPWVAGWFAGPLRREAEALAVLAESLERERQGSARLAVARERARLARELHDAIAHAVSAMVIQAAAAEAVLSEAPAQARRALRAVQSAGRDAVAELHRVLRILREVPAAEPSPSGPVRVVRTTARGRGRWPVWRPVFDVLLALACLVVGEREIFGGDIYGAAGAQQIQALLLAAGALGLIVRRRWPLAVLLTSVGVLAAQRIIDGLPIDFPPGVLVASFIAVFTVGVRCTARVAAAATAATVAIAAIADAIAWGELTPWSVYFYSVLFVIFALSGHAVRLHRANAEQLRRLTWRLRAERDALARLAVIEERTRTARDLHDAIAHGVSVMVLQAGGAEQVLTVTPERARIATRAVQDTGRAVLEELHRLLGLLDDDEPEPRAPQPSLSRLDALVAHVRGAGLPLEVRIEGEPVVLASGIDASAYRVIQEALTNALKHARTAPTVVAVRYEPTAIGVEIRSQRANPPAAEPGASGGQGLVGMRERVERFGGQLAAGPEPSGAYVVRARIPVPGGET